MGENPADARLMVGLLGTVEIGPADGMLAGLAQPRLRVLLGLLGVAAGRVASAEALVDGLWGEEWSPGRELNLHGQVSALRRRLEQAGPGQGEAGPGGGRVPAGAGAGRAAAGVAPATPARRKPPGCRCTPG